MSVSTRRIFALTLAGGLALTGCATAPTAAAPTSAGATSSAHEAGTRITLTYDGGVYVLDGQTLDVLADIPLAGFNRVNPAGDDSHVIVSTADGFQVLETGATGARPALTDLVIPAVEAGHVVRHQGRTVLFADGTGDITIFDSADLDGPALPDTETVSSEAAHHGVAIELADGTLLSTLGTTESRSGVRVLDESRTETDRSEQCPSVHGEGTVKDDVAVFGCSDGVLVYDGEFTKIPAPDAYGRTGNAYVTDTSSVMVGDYNADPDSEGYLLSELAFVDTAAKTLDVLELPAGAEYTWRGVARGPQDEVVLLASNGSLYTFDESGVQTAVHPVIAPWQGPIEWQHAHPALSVAGGTAYITEPATKQVHAIDLATGEVLRSITLDVAANEIAVVGS